MLPKIQRVLNVAPHGASAWANTFRIDVHLFSGEESSYFMKVIAPRISHMKGIASMCRIPQAADYYC